MRNVSSPLNRLIASPTHRLVDPALAATLIGIDSAGLLRVEGDRLEPADGALLGALFESLATQTVRVLAQAAEADVAHLRTKAGDHEIDLIVEGRDRRVVALEVKLKATINDDDVRHLHWLHAALGDALPPGWFSRPDPTLTDDPTASPSCPLLSSAPEVPHSPPGGAQPRVACGTSVPGERRLADVV